MWSLLRQSCGTGVTGRVTWTEAATGIGESDEGRVSTARRGAEDRIGSACSLIPRCPLAAAALSTSQGVCRGRKSQAGAAPLWAWGRRASVRSLSFVEATST